MEGVEVSHDPVVVNLHLLQVEVAVVGVELQVEVGVAVALVAALDETNQASVVVWLDTKGDYLVH